MIPELDLIGCALFVALGIAKKDLPFSIGKKLRSTGWTVLNCVLCCYGWTVLMLFGIAYYFGDFSAFAMASKGLSLVGWGWFALSLIGVSNWDN